MEFVNNGGSFGANPVSSEAGTASREAGDTGSSAPGGSNKKLSLTQLEIISKMISNNQVISMRSKFFFNSNNVYVKRTGFLSNKVHY